MNAPRKFRRNLMSVHLAAELFPPMKTRRVVCRGCLHHQPKKCRHFSIDSRVMFPVVEHIGEVTSYGDFAESGHTGANTNWPQRQSYLFQTVKEYGERELELAGLARINWVAEIDEAAATVLNKFSNGRRNPAWAVCSGVYGGQGRWLSTN